MMPFGKKQKSRAHEPGTPQIRKKDPQNKFSQMLSRNKTPDIGENEVQNVSHKKSVEIINVDTEASRITQRKSFEQTPMDIEKDGQNILQISIMMMNVNLRSLVFEFRHKIKTCPKLIYQKKISIIR